jgi:hypothetical protein
MGILARTSKPPPSSNKPQQKQQQSRKPPSGFPYVKEFVDQVYARNAHVIAEKNIKIITNGMFHVLSDLRKMIAVPLPPYLLLYIFKLVDWTHLQPKQP